MRIIKLPLGILLAITVAACGGGGSYGGGGTGSAGIYSISGTVSGGNTGNSGVMISLTGAATNGTTTAAAGSYSFTGLLNGSYTVTPSLSGYTFTPASATVTVNFDNPSNINFTQSP